MSTFTYFDSPKKAIIQGNEICYYRSGKGQTLLFIHGITTYSFIWRKVIPFFVDDFDVIALDLLGCGDSAIPLKEDISLKRQAEMIHEFCVNLKLNKVHLVCHDVGGGIGQIIAVNYPELLFDLTLVNSVAYNFWPVQPIVAMRTPIIRQFAMAALDFGMFEIIVKRGLYNERNATKELMAYFWKPMKSKLGRKGFLHFAKCLNNKDLTELGEALSKLKLPVLILRGDNDVYLTSSISIRLHEDIPNSRLVIIKKGGHFIQEDQPEKLAKNILDFVK